MGRRFRGAATILVERLFGAKDTKEEFNIKSPYKKSVIRTSLTSCHSALSPHYLIFLLGTSVSRTNFAEPTLTYYHTERLIFVRYRWLMFYCFLEKKTLKGFYCIYSKKNSFSPLLRKQRFALMHMWTYCVNAYANKLRKHIASKATFPFFFLMMTQFSSSLYSYPRMAVVLIQLLADIKN